MYAIVIFGPSRDESGFFYDIDMEPTHELSRAKKYDTAEDAESAAVRALTHWGEGDYLIVTL